MDVYLTITALITHHSSSIFQEPERFGFMSTPNMNELMKVGGEYLTNPRHSKANQDHPSYIDTPSRPFTQPIDPTIHHHTTPLQRQDSLVMRQSHVQEAVCGPSRTSRK